MLCGTSVATDGNRDVTQHQRRPRINLGLFPKLHIQNASALGLQTRHLISCCNTAYNKAVMQVGGRHRRCAHRPQAEVSRLAQRVL